MVRFRISLIIAMLALLAVPGFSLGVEESLPTPLARHFSERYRDDLDGLLEKKYIRVLTTLNKTNFFIYKGRPHGYEYALMKAYEKFLNQRFKRKELRVVLEFIPVPRDQLIPGVVDGRGDIAAAGLTITGNRLSLVDFTNPYLTGIDEIVVTNEEALKPKRLDDLSGRTVFIRKSSSYFERVLNLNRKLSKAKKPRVEIIEADENLETEDILELVNSGAVKITISDSHIASIWSSVLKNLRLHEELKLHSGGKIAWAIRKSNPKLKSSLNTFLKSHKKGTLYGNIQFDRYYKDNPWIKNPLRQTEMKKLSRYRDLFKKYAEKYGFDWLLIMAMGYQETGLNHNKQNPSGAIGILQVMPDTARSIGIQDVHLLENNVHAGVKYLALLKRKYFNDEEIVSRDRVRFALAAYNAGPSKIKRARSLAEKMGLDSNRWFRNVELATLELVQQETVRYVSNINKYYVMYRLAFEKEEMREQEKRQLKATVK